MIEFIHGLFNLTLDDGRQIPIFREVLPYESIGILIQSTFPRGIRMREIDASLKATGHTLMVGKFTAIVVGDGMHPVDIHGVSPSTTASRTASAVL